MVGETRSRRLGRRQAAVMVVAFVALGAITFNLALQGTSPRPAPSAGPTGGPAPSVPSTRPSTAPTEAWSPLELSALQASATLEPSNEDLAGVPPDTTFTLASLTDEPASALAERLEVSPEMAFTLASTGDGKAATIKPSAALTTGRTYRFALRSPDGTVDASWAFQVRGPVNVTTTIPGDATNGVPVRTGIEVTFDQEGVADMADHFSIEPRVDGTFERHGRTQVFVPTELAARTMYTVTVRKGLARTGTDLSLLSDVVFRFETEGEDDGKTRLVFGRDVIESSPADPPLIAVRAERRFGQEAVAPGTAAVRVYRLPTVRKATDVLAAFLAAPRWTQFSDPLMPTKGLPVAVAFTASLESIGNNLLLVRFPAPLHAGWYIVEVGGDQPAHAFLQVTPVSAWVSVLTDLTVVWVNDVATHRAASGATVALGSGQPFAHSDIDGLAIGPTPGELNPPAVAGDDSPPPYPILRVTAADGNVVLVPFNVRGEAAAYRGEWWETFRSADETYWAMLYTDRALYRRSDRIQLWGYLRSRDDDKPPTSVSVRLVANESGDDPAAPAIASIDVTPNADGAFSASLPVNNLTIDNYQVQAVVAGRVVVSRWVEVSTIRKPAYQLDLTTDHSAIVTGSQVNWKASASFFDGTPVGSVDLVLSGDQTGPDRTVTTNTAGQVTVPITVPATGQSGSDISEDADNAFVHVRPAGPESAEIWADRGVLVFPSAYTLNAKGVVTGSKLRVTGTLHLVDLAKVERQIADGTWRGDASGAAVAGKTMDVTVTELVPVRHLVATEYNFIEKVSEPVYEYTTERKPVPPASVTSRADGTFTLSVEVPNTEHEYEVVLQTRDDGGRLQRRTITAGKAVVDPWWVDLGVVFRAENGSPAGDDPYRIGAPLTWQMIDDGRTLPTSGDDRYLYLVAQRGLRSAFVSDASTFRRTFGAADAPGIFVIGVRFTGSTYAPKAAAWANFDQTQREIRVQITADRERYRPGETATLSVRTTLPNGSPVAATVEVQAVDEKIYAIGGATIARPLDDLYGRVDSGIIRLTATHQVPTMSGPEGEGGDTTGGGERSDFKDTLLFRQIRTDATGRASTTMKLSDDLTSWHVTASAVTGHLQAGVGDLLVPVGLPFFVDVITADTYLVSDRPSIQARAFGDALRVGDPVEFTVSSTALGLAQTTIQGRAFEPIGIALPALSIGTASIRLSATATTRRDAAGKPLHDGLVQTFDVVASRLTATKATYGVVGDGSPSIPEGAEQSTWTFTDAGRGRLIPILSHLSIAPGVRIDRGIASSMARQGLVDAFGRDPAAFASSDFDPSPYPCGSTSDGQIVRWGVALLPYSGLDPWLAARLAVEAPDALNRGCLQGALAGTSSEPSTKRDLRIATLAGMAALDEPVLGDLQAAWRQPDLSPTEQIYLALGFEAAGDDASALAIERGLLTRFGERLGASVRLRLDPTADGADPTALLAVVAAGLGDPLAADLAEYAFVNPALDTENSLELAAYAARYLQRTPAAPAAFAYTVDGARSVVRLAAGEAFTLTLTAAQAADLTVENVSGRVGVAIEARVAVSPDSLRPSSDLTLTRTPPTMPIPANQVVYVDLAASFGARAPDGCYDVVELVPSGLAPLTIGAGQFDEARASWPTSVVGQEVHFCALNDASTGRAAHLRYAARVVSVGTFAWEPATMQLAGSPELLAVTPAGTATVGVR